MTQIGERLQRVRHRIGVAAERAGRDPEEVRLVGATKGVPVPLIEEAVHAGLTDVGENRAQDLREKAGSLSPHVRWHFLGPLQTNKVRYLDDVELVHALSRAREAEALQARAERTGRRFQVLVEVNVAAEPSKHGVAPDELDGLLSEIGKYPLVTPRGVMIVAPQVENHEDVRWVFTEARRLRDRFATDDFRELSMGMTDDFEVAIEEGATIVRIGRAIFH
jgi:pyridoxal phosphate enzyme (YggS family)